MLRNGLKNSNSTLGYPIAILCLKTGLWSDELSGDHRWQMYQRNYNVVIIFSFRLTFRLIESVHFSRPSPEMESSSKIQSLVYSRGLPLKVLDQTKLPHEHGYIEVANCEQGWKVINEMNVSSTFV